MRILFSLEFLTIMLFATIRMAVPLIFAGLGELYSERSGVINIGLEGLMTMGALGGFFGSYFSGSPWIGLLVGLGSGILTNLIFGYATISRNGDQIVNGMALNILALGVASYVYRSYFGIRVTPVRAPGFANIQIPLLKDIPVLGEGLFVHNPVVYLAVLLVVLSYIFLYKTSWGLMLRATGEHPRAVDTLGINVKKEKYLACILCGALAGMGGAYLTLAYMNMFMEGMVAGRGFIALAVVIFGRWMPGGVLMASLLFGFTEALQLRLQALGVAVPYQFLMMLPYLLTMFALLLFVGKSVSPAANGKPYFREGK